MRSRSRDEDFTRFFRAESNGVERFATMLAGDPLQGAELAQEAFARVYAHWRRLDDYPVAYTKRVVVNLVRSAHRAKKVRAAKPVPEWAAGKGRVGLRSSDQVDDSLRVLDALAELSPVRRATVLLRFYEDLSEQEIARVLDRPLGTVKSDIHRALRQLRPLLEGDDTGERQDGLRR